MYEAELKFRISEENRSEIQERLLSFEPLSVLDLTCLDLYFDDSTHSFSSSEKELRIRKRYGPHLSDEEVFLTFKDSPFDPPSRSKPELEISVDDGEKLEEILMSLGFKKWLEIKKHCTLYTFEHSSYQVEAALVRVDGVEGYFLELEIGVETLKDSAEALTVLSRISKQLGMSKESFTNEYYTDIVRSRGK
jgi:predicted adenylyl cyclase CyaB